MFVEKFVCKRPYVDKKHIREEILGYVPKKTQKNVRNDYLRLEFNGNRAKITMNPSDNPSRVEEEYKRLLKARRMAKRSRSAAACVPCKARKTKCNDFRPCTRCAATHPEECIDEIPEETGGSASLLPNRGVTRISNDLMNVANPNLPFEQGEEAEFGQELSSPNFVSGATTNAVVSSDKRMFLMELLLQC